jgi:predicted phage terminase large subunit-like protein
MHTVKKVRAYDIAGTLVSEMNPDPDFTVGVLMSKDKFGTYYIEDVVKYRARFGEVFDRIVATAKEDGDETLIVIPQDAGAAGKAYAMTMIRDLSEQGFYAKAKPTNQSKITRFAPFCAASESGSIKIVKGEWNEDFIQELTDFDGNRKRKRHDDQVDSCGDAFMFLCSTIQIPTFSIPDMTTTNSFSF